MSENLIDAVVTKNDLKKAFEKLGAKSTDSCIVRTAMSKIQYFPVELKQSLMHLRKLYLMEL